MSNSAPIPMRLNCPSCGKLHIDEGEFATKPHHTHACQSCGMVWRPAIVCTVGVRFLPGFKNDELPLTLASLKEMRALMQTLPDESHVYTALYHLDASIEKMEKAGSLR